MLGLSAATNFEAVTWRFEGMAGVGKVSFLFLEAASCSSACLVIGLAPLPTLALPAVLEASFGGLPRCRASF